MRYEKKDLLCFVFYNIYYSVFYDNIIEICNLLIFLKIDKMRKARRRLSAALFG